MRCGFELEVSGGAGNVLANLREMGLTGHRNLHPYHCGCGECEPEVHGQYPFKAQMDCTADGEFISGILEYGTPYFESAVAGMGAALLKSGASCSGRVGNHVHIDFRQFRDDYAAQRRLFRLFARYQRELLEVAAASFDRMRTYNGESIQVRDALWNDIDTGTYGQSYWSSGGHLLAWKGRTVEFRLWNSTREAWRIRTHIGLSHAMAEAALDGVDCERDDVRCVEDVLGEHIDGPTWAGILRQRFSKGGVAADIAA